MDAYATGSATTINSKMTYVGKESKTITEFTKYPYVDKHQQSAKKMAEV